MTDIKKAIQRARELGLHTESFDGPVEKISISAKDIKRQSFAIEDIVRGVVKPVELGIKVGDLICHHWYSQSDMEPDTWKWHHHRVLQVTPKYIFVISECWHSLYKEPFALTDDGVRIRLRTLRLDREKLVAGENVKAKHGDEHFNLTEGAPDTEHPWILRADKNKSL